MPKLKPFKINSLFITAPINNIKEHHIGAIISFNAPK